jgi:hypothetical protein
MEDEARLQGRLLADMTLEEMDGLWNAAKRLEANLKSGGAGKNKEQKQMD